MTDAWRQTKGPGLRQVLRACCVEDLLSYFEIDFLRPLMLVTIRFQVSIERALLETKLPKTLA